MDVMDIVDEMLADVEVSANERGGLVYVRMESISLAALEVKVAEYMKSYHPAGYDTYFRPPVFDEENRVWISHGSRSSKC